ncbi:MAG: hypothetical protein AB1427_08710 [Thermodesulfobacteriota bacterium]
MIISKKLILAISVLAILTVDKVGSSDERGQKILDLIRRDFQTELRINEMYFNEMSKSSTLKEQYEIFYKYRMAYLKAELLSEIAEMKTPHLGTPANHFPSIISYVDDEQKWEWSPFSRELFEDYKRQVLKYTK